jgi:hypothetical protein
VAMAGGAQRRGKWGRGWSGPAEPGGARQPAEAGVSRRRVR